MKSFYPLVLFLLFIGSSLSAADYYWIGGSGNWSDISHWATTSGGFVTHNTSPTAEDNVFFDNNSFTAPGQMVTIDANIIFCRDFIWQDDTQGAFFAGGDSTIMNVFGAFQLSTNMQYDLAGDVIFQGSNQGNTIDLAGQALGRNVIFDGATASWSLASPFQVDSLFIFRGGSLMSESEDIICERFRVRILNAGSLLDLDSSSVTMTGIDIDPTRYPYSQTVFLEGSEPGSLQFGDAHFFLNGSTVKFQNNYYAEGLELGSLNFTSEFGEAILQIDDRNLDPVRVKKVNSQNNTTFGHDMIIDSLILGGGKNFAFRSADDFDIGYIGVESGCQEPIQINSTFPFLPANFTSSSATIDVDFVTLRGINASGGAAFTANNSVDAGNNSGWTINMKNYQELYWVGGTGMWDDSAHWSFTSGGPGGACIPTPGEDVIFDDNSFNSPMDMVLINVENAFCRSFRWETSANNPVLRSDRTKNLRIFGGLNLDPGMGYEFQGRVFFETKDSAQTITTGLHRFTNDVFFNGVGGWILQDDFVVNQDIYFQGGKLNTNDQLLQNRQFFSEYTTPRTLELTNSTFRFRDTVTYFWLWANIYTDNLTLDAGTSTIDYAGTGTLRFEGEEPVKLHRVVKGGGGYVEHFSGNEAFLEIDSLELFFWNRMINDFQANTIIINAGYDLRLRENDTLRFDTMIINGGCGLRAEIIGEVQGDRIYLDPTRDVSIPNVILRDVENASAFQLSATNAVDLGNNVNVQFMEDAGRDLYWVGDGGEWMDPIHWSLSSGGPGGECPPGPNDNVYFDANSFSLPDQRVSVSEFSYSKNMSWDNLAFMAYFSFYEHHQFGELFFTKNMDISNNLIRFRSDSLNQGVNTAGHRFWSALFDGKGSWILEDTLNTRYYEHLTGTVHTNGQALINNGVSFYTNNEKALDMQDTHWRFEGDRSEFTSWFASGDANLSTAAENSEVEFVRENPEIRMYHSFNFDEMLFSNNRGESHLNNFISDPDSVKFNRLEIRNNGLFQGSMHGDTIIFTPGKTYQLDSGEELVGSEYIQMFGNNCTPIEVRSRNTGEQAMLVSQNGVVKADFVQMRDLRAVGEIDFYAGVHSTDISNNTNWIFDSAEEFIEEGFLGQDVVLCNSSTLILDANNFSPNETYLWQDGSTDSIFVVTQPGLYRAEVTFGNNCIIVDTVQVLPPQDFMANLPDTVNLVCAGDTLQLNSGLDLVGLRYVWQDSSTSRTFNVTEPGEYKVTVELSGCTSSDSTMVRYIDYPVFSLGNDTTLCADSSFVLNALTDTATYRWIDGSTMPEFTLSSPGTYWVDVAYGSCATRDSIDISYFDPIPLDLGADTTICDETSLVLDATINGASYLWFDNSTGPQVTVDAAGDYVVEVMLNNCPAVDTISVSIQDLPRFELGEDTEICDQESITLDGTSLPGTTYEWSTGETTATIDVTATGFYALQTTLNGCTFVDTRSINVKPLPIVDLGPDQTLCEEEVLTLDVEQTDATYLWQDNSTNATLDVRIDGQYSVTVELNACTAEDTINVTFNPLPRFELGEAAAICEGESITLDGTSLPGTAYEWSTGETTATIDVGTTGFYALQATLDGCTFVDTRDITVKPLPIVDLGPDQVLCEEEVLTLDVDQTGATYLWQDNSNNATFAVSMDGQYFVSVNLDECIVEDTINVSFNPLPRFELGPDESICEEESILLDGTSLPGTTYEWSDGSTGATLEVRTDGFFALEATLDGCTFTDSKQITVKPLPIVDLGVDQTLCDEEVATLDVTQAGATYLWQDGSTNGSFAVSQNGTYFVTVDLDACLRSDSVNFTFTPLPRFNLGADTLLCEGETLALDGTVAGATYQWSTGSTNAGITVENAGTYSLTTSANGCDFSDEIMVTYGIIPADLLGGDQVRCDGEVIDFNLNIPNAMYQWIDGSLSPIYQISNEGTYGVRVNIDRCVGGDTINVSYNPLPIFNLGNDTLLCEGAPLPLSINVMADSYQWQDGSTAPTFSVAFPGTYVATATLDNCSFTDELIVDYQASRSISLGPDTTICEQTPLLLNVPGRADAILWQDGSTQRTFNVAQAGTYFVEVVDGVCTFGDTINIQTRECFRFKAYRPTAFSPNGDGVNDEFQIGLPPNTQIIEYEMQVFNRWGSLVFTTMDFNEAWNGFINDELAPGGVYIYSIRIKYRDDFREDEEIIKGDVMLMR